MAMCGTPASRAPGRGRGPISQTTTSRPARATASASASDTVDLPTPPLPVTTAMRTSALLHAGVLDALGDVDDRVADPRAAAVELAHLDLAPQVGAVQQGPH